MTVLIKPHSFNYRPEIDGLRAIAVLSVMLFHAGFSFLRNGYLGVDIFFVISGYLITGILLNDLSNKQFSLLHFYERRARRILPALTIVLVITSIVAWFWLLPHELIDFGKSLFSASLFHANVHFAGTSGYFAAAAEQLPLLHTWSLAVEEQFYFIFPVVLYLVWRYFRRFALPIFFTLTLISYGYFVVKLPTDSANYYMPHLRAWELLLGVMAALTLQNQPIPAASPKQDMWPMLGLALIALAFSLNLPVSWVTLLACLGTFLVIKHGQAKGLFNVLLSNRVLVWIGLISYSAYLWHFPVLAFARLQFSYHNGTDWGYGLIALCLLLAWLSWKWVEQPFRNKVFLSRAQLFAISVLSIGALAGAGMFLQADAGQQQRAGMQGIKHYSAIRAQRGWGEQFCNTHALKSRLGENVCVIGDAEQAPIGVLWGDSLAGSMVYGLNEVLKKKKVAFVAVISNACPPVEGLHHPQYACNPTRHSQTVEQIMRDSNLQYVVWIGNFIGGMNHIGTPIKIGDHLTSPALVQKSMIATLKRLSEHGKQVVLIKTPPKMFRSVPEFYMRKKINDSKGELAISVDHYRRFIAPMTPVVDAVPANVSVVDTEKYFCDARYCYARNLKDELLYVDTNHFTHKKSLQIANDIINEHLKL
ncbi:acyltransferase family protein [Methylophilus sp. TWE2]|uniref:acyltransferase family protein n=1 Tax=Methylophilus sp. TWE2 TaxID=1662285 RepID=UPI000670EE86|nr:acyltransferase family protein [Methylophilus sp. TWE2]